MTGKLCEASCFHEIMDAERDGLGKEFHRTFGGKGRHEFHELAKDGRFPMTVAAEEFNAKVLRSKDAKG